MSDWHVITEMDIDKEAFKRECSEKGVTFFLDPIAVTPMENHGGLLCHGDESWCWIMDDEPPQWLKDDPRVKRVHEQSGFSI